MKHTVISYYFYQVRDSLRPDALLSASPNNWLFLLEGRDSE